VIRTAPANHGEHKSGTKRAQQSEEIAPTHPLKLTAMGLRRNDGLQVLTYRNLVDAALVRWQKSYHMLQGIVTPAKAGVQCL
jgi:hypothetical protein